MSRNLSLFTLMLTATWVSFAPGSTHAAMIYLVSLSGQGIVEAEHYDTKVDHTAPESWDVLSSPSSGSFANASGGQYIRALPDDGTPSRVSGGPPYVEYVFRVPDLPSALGNYLLFFRAAGPNTSGDSIYWRVYKASDLSLIANIPGTAGVSVGSAPAWDTGVWNSVSTTIPIPAAGDYIVRVTPREDGVAIDKLSFQLDTLPAPSNFGPAESPLFVELVPAPEPSTALLLIGGILLGLKQRSKARNGSGCTQSTSW